MKKVFLAVALSSVLFSFGCARYQPPQDTYTTANLELKDLQSKVVQGAMRARWHVCKVDEDLLRIDRVYKHTAVVTYAYLDSQGYRLKIDTEATDLKDEDGRIHRNVNKLVRKLDKVIQLTVPSDETFTMETCPKISDTVALRGHMFTNEKATSSFAWVTDKVVLPENTTFDYDVIANSEFPQSIIDSMHERVGTSLLEKNLLAKTQKVPYKLYINMMSFVQNGQGGFADAVTGKGYQEMKIDAFVTDPDGKKICTAKVSTYVPIGGMWGINKASNKITETANRALFMLLEDNLFKSAEAQ